MPTFLFPITTFMLFSFLLSGSLGYYQFKTAKVFINPERLSDWVAIFAISTIVSVTLIGFCILIGL